MTICCHMLCILPFGYFDKLIPTNELKFMTISQPCIKSNIFYCHTGLVLMNAIATQDCIDDPTFRHSSPSVFIRDDLMLKTQDFIYSSNIHYIWRWKPGILMLVLAPLIAMMVAICHKNICILLANDIMLLSI